MTDREEMVGRHYSSLYNADLDMDGFNDNDEMIAGTNPMDARSVPPSNSMNQLTVAVKLTVGDESGSNRVFIFWETCYCHLSVQ
jgi:hypothetical protein